MIDMHSLISMKNSQIIIRILTILTHQLQQLQFITQSTMVQYMSQDELPMADIEGLHMGTQQDMHMVTEQYLMDEDIGEDMLVTMMSLVPSVKK